MIDDKWSFWSDKEKKLFQHSVPWDDVIQELYKTCSRKQIFNLMETGELSYVVNMIDEAKPHGLDALWLYGSDRLESFLRDYNVWFYRDSLSDVLCGEASEPEQAEPAKPEKIIISQEVVSFPGVIEWSEVFLTVRNDTYFEVKYPRGMENLSREQAGFTPDEWALLRIFAKRWEELKPSNIPKVKMKVSRLRKALKRLFPDTKGNPIIYKRSAYKTAFTIRLGEYAE